MKLKRWLFLSHLLVILTPILTGMLLYNFIVNYNKKIELNDYLATLGKFKTYEKQLDNPKIYIDPQKNIKFIKKEDENTLQISLYNAIGQRLYTSNEDLWIPQTKEALYSDLYKIQQGYKACTLKKPVFDDNMLVGFYQVTITRENFIEGVNNKTIFAAICFVVVILMVYVTVILLLNRKFNKPMKVLIEGMNDFAKGNISSIKYYNKDEIGELIEHFNNMKEELEEKRKIIESQQKTKEYMISAISHDLKTPLTAIRAYAEAIGNQNDLNLLEIKNKSIVILNKSDYMKKMIDDLMTYTLLTSDYNMEFVEVEGSEFFEMLFSGYDETCERNDIKLFVETCIDGMYEVDVKQMMRVVDNLMTNAIRYTKKGKQIWIGAFSLNYNLPAWIEDEFKEKIKNWKNEGCILIVKNEGEEIKEEEQNKIFKPFYQTDDSRNKTSQSGVGLGLSIVNLVIQKHNGELKLLSQGNSTAFVCWIPNKDI
ncbi:ATP-binding protein [Clostridium thailandense]|uniref:HAMP domain-containing sensor histidine kinase n=1 Tax=Clostridium thailandense TaxID=2794346 RepID=UPI00398913E6